MVIPVFFGYPEGQIGVAKSDKANQPEHPLNESMKK
jgi:hypothetical protein